MNISNLTLKQNDSLVFGNRIRTQEFCTISMYSLNKNHVAVKKSIKEKDISRTSIKELHALAVLKNIDGIVDLIGVKFDFEMEDVSCKIILELCDCDLHTYISCVDREKLFHSHCELLIDIIRQILLPVEYMHSIGIWHLDIKPENVLVNLTKTTPRIKLADMGLSLQTRVNKNNIKLKHFNNVSTPLYRPPELYKKENFTYFDSSADIWSLGCTIFELVTERRLAFISAEPQYVKIKNLLPDIFSSFIIPLEFDQKIIENIHEYSNHIDVVGKFNAILTDDEKISLPYEILLMLEDMLQLNPNNRIDINDAITMIGLGERSTIKNKYPVLQKENYLLHSNLTNKIIHKTFGWLIDMSKIFQLKFITLIISIDLFHRCASSMYKNDKKNHICKENIHLITFACLFLSCKFYEVNHPSIDEIMIHTDECFIQKILVDTQIYILDAVEYIIYNPEIDRLINLLIELNVDESDKFELFQDCLDYMYNNEIDMSKTPFDFYIKIINKLK